MEVIGSGHDAEEKPVLYFNGKEKGLVLNKTNAQTIASLHSPETDNWPGRSISIFPTQVDFQGRQVEAIRVKLQQPQQQAPPPPAAEVSYKQNVNNQATDDSDIPFAWLLPFLLPLSLVPFQNII